MLTVSDLKRLKREIPNDKERMAFLLSYYSEHPDGIKEFMESPHAHRPVLDVVIDLMDEMDNWKD